MFLTYIRRLAWTILLKVNSIISKWDNHDKKFLSLRPRIHNFQHYCSSPVRFEGICSSPTINKQALIFSTFATFTDVVPLCSGCGKLISQNHGSITPSYYCISPQIRLASAMSGMAVERGPGAVKELDTDSRYRYRQLAMGN
jgi:hypothetical protein